MFGVLPPAGLSVIFSGRQENEKGRWGFLRKNLLGEEVGRVGREI